MARKRFWVDWKDSAFPRIRPEEDADSWEEMMTFSEAKKEITDHFHNQIDHASGQIRITRALRVADIRSWVEIESDW